MNFLLPQDLGDAIVNYLIKQPYAEVSGLIEGLKSLQRANVVQQEAQPVDSSQSEEAAQPEATA